MRMQYKRFCRRLLTIFAAVTMSVCPPHSILLARQSRPQQQSAPGTANMTLAPVGADNPTLKITMGDEGVSRFAVSMDAHELLMALAEKTGHRVIVDDTVKRTITVNLRNRSCQEIIDNIVAAYGFACRTVDGICMVSEGIPKKPSSYLLSDIDTISTQYVVASQAKSLFPVFLQDNVKTNMAQNAHVRANPRIVTVSGREAQVFVGVQQYLSTPIETEE